VYNRTVDVAGGLRLWTYISALYVHTVTTSMRAFQPPQNARSPPHCSVPLQEWADRFVASFFLHFLEPKRRSQQLTRNYPRAAGEYCVFRQTSGKGDFDPISRSIASARNR
jgi:hypothetical protein